MEKEFKNENQVKKGQLDNNLQSKYFKGVLYQALKGQGLKWNVVGYKDIFITF